MVDLAEKYKIAYRYLKEPCAVSGRNSFIDFLSRGHVLRAYYDYMRDVEDLRLSTSLIDIERCFFNLACLYLGFGCFVEAVDLDSSS